MSETRSARMGLYPMEQAEENAAMHEKNCNKERSCGNSTKVLEDLMTLLIIDTMRKFVRILRDILRDILKGMGKQVNDEVRQESMKPGYEQVGMGLS